MVVTGSGAGGCSCFVVGSTCGGSSGTGGPGSSELDGSSVLVGGGSVGDGLGAAGGAETLLDRPGHGDRWSGRNRR